MNSTIYQNSSPSIQFINPLTLYDPTPNAYSHIAIVHKFDRIVHISGQGAENNQGILSDHFDQQVCQTFKNIKNAMIAINVNLENIAVLKILVVDHNTEKHRILINHIKNMWNNTHFPACTLIPVHRLALPNMLIEIEVTAYC